MKNVISLAEDLQLRKENLPEFKNITIRVLNYIVDVLNQESVYGKYIICSSKIAGTTKPVRPYNQELFLRKAKSFEKEFLKFEAIINNLKNKNVNNDKSNYHTIDSILYTIQQSIGIGLDLLVEPNSARKNVGNRFEELIRVLMKDLGIPMKKVTLSIPYETDEGEKFYRCETDVIISPYSEVRSNPKNIDPNEIVISLKTTTKDRMPKIFIDKVLIEKFLGHNIKVVGISQNDIQRNETLDGTKISSTFVSNLFMVYTKFLTKLDGYYYIDPPNMASKQPFNQYIFPFSKFVIDDVWKLLNS